MYRMEEKIVYLILKGQSVNKIYVNNFSNISNIDATDAYICVDKFIGKRNGINIPNIKITCSGLREVYENDVDIGLKMSNTLDNFFGEYITPALNVNTQTSFNTKNNIENYIKINVLDLDRLLFNFIPFQVNNLIPVNIDFDFEIYLKFKLIKK